MNFALSLVLSVRKYCVLTVPVAGAVITECVMVFPHLYVPALSGRKSSENIRNSFSHCRNKFTDTGIQTSIAGFLPPDYKSHP
jgi:hypothetical protein